MSIKYSVTVIGAGASGIIAAAEAKKAGADVTLIERNSAIGRKIAATGNGRCNFTNADADNIMHYYGGNSEFIKNVLKNFSRDKILKLFDEIGATPVLEDDGKYFPLSGQAASVCELLCRYIESCGVKILYDTKVNDIKLTDKSVNIVTDNGILTADRVIIATGGMASPDSGSDGMGYEFAKKIGHTVKKTMPVIVQLKTKGGFYKRLSGIRINGRAMLVVDGKTIDSADGDIMFFDYGLSGSAVFKISPKAVYMLDSEKRVFVNMDFVPMYSNENLTEYMKKRVLLMPCTVEDMLVGFINKKLISLIIEAAEIDPEKKANILSEAEIKRLVTALKSFKTEITGTKGWENAQATAGGIPLDEIEPDTLRSKKDSRIAFCGEVLDVVGDCGGYNLTWAWASGYTAGRSICK